MLDHYLISSTGGRENNQDCADVFEAHGVCGFVVCDGVGGCRFGDVASKVVCEQFRKPFIEGAGSIDDCIEKGVDSAEAALRELQRQANDPRAYKSTIAALLISGEDVYTVHVGDSRIYHLADGKRLWRTTDHSLAQMMVMTGDIEPDGIRTCEDRNVLLHAMGSASDTFRFQSSVRKLEGSEYDAFIICSDGFWEYVTGERMARTLDFGRKNIPDFNARDWLCALAAGMEPEAGNDNFTAVAVIVSKE